MLEVGSRVRVSDLSGRFYVNDTQKQFVGKTGVVKAINGCPTSLEVIFDIPIARNGYSVTSSLFTAPELTKM